MYTHGVVPLHPVHQLGQRFAVDQDVLHHRVHQRLRRLTRRVLRGLQIVVRFDKRRIGAQQHLGQAVLALVLDRRLRHLRRRYGRRGRRGTEGVRRRVIVQLHRLDGVAVAVGQAGCQLHGEVPVVQMAAHRRVIQIQVELLFVAIRRDVHAHGVPPLHPVHQLGQRFAVDQDVLHHRVHQRLRRLARRVLRGLQIVVRLGERRIGAQQHLGQAVLALVLYRRLRHLRRRGSQRRQQCRHQTDEQHHRRQKHRKQAFSSFCHEGSSFISIFPDPTGPIFLPCLSIIVVLP